MHPLIPWFEIPVFEIPFAGRVLPLHGFGMLVALGFVLGGKAAMGRARTLGLDPEVINRLVGWLVFGTFVGGHVGYGLMYEPQEYLADPIKFLYVWQGLSSFGGFLVCVPLAIWFFWKEQVPLWKYLDCLAYGMAIGWFFGRMGCFVAHDHPGTPTDFWLGVYCRPVEGHMIDLPSWMVAGEGHRNLPWGPCEGNPSVLATHDMGLYEALWSLSMFGVFTLTDRIRALPSALAIPGVMTLTLGLFYGPVRFAMDSLRPVSHDPRYLGFTPAQHLAALLTVVCLSVIVWRMRSGDEPVRPTAGG